MNDADAGCTSLPAIQTLPSSLQLQSGIADGRSSVAKKLSAMAFESVTNCISF